MNRAERRRQAREACSVTWPAGPRAVTQDGVCVGAEPVAVVLLFDCGCSLVLDPVLDDE